MQKAFGLRPDAFLLPLGRDQDFLSQDPFPGFFRKFPSNFHMRIFCCFLSFLANLCVQGQSLLTPFERSEGTQTTTYVQCIDFYTRLDQASHQLSIKKMGMSDAGYPLDVVLYANDGTADPRVWRQRDKLIILILNGIHPGEPDGIDASMLYMRDLVQGRTHLPDNIALAIIPVYNIGGALNRNAFSRANQVGPASYGFRGNAQNLDLNRDFTKCDSRNARSFAAIFHWLDPDIELDTHTSDGADYQHTMTLISTQWNKLGGALGQFLHDQFDPALFQSMQQKGWPMCPYVNFEEGSLEQGWTAFYDSPRYSSGYAALFHTLSFMSETHMLKPFADRVRSTYALIETLVTVAAGRAQVIRSKRKQDFRDDLGKTDFALSWKADSLHYDSVNFSGYRAQYRTSQLTGQKRLFYDHSKPFQQPVRFYDYFTADHQVHAPKAYLIPQGWHEVIDLLKLNGVQFQRLKTDTQLAVQTYHIGSYSSSAHPYEKHHKNSAVDLAASVQSIRFLQGDYLVYCNQPAKRFLVEMLEPAGDDSYFCWNFFDAILQQKESYSDYRWEDLAATYIGQHPELAQSLEQRKKSDSAFARDGSAQLHFIYQHSPYQEPEYLRYPVFRLL
jgi:hypothetical protein